MKKITFRGIEYMIVGFYRYPSFVCPEEKYNYIDNVGNQDLEKLYNDCAELMKDAGRTYNINFFENKTAFILESESKKGYTYIGAKDLYYILGNSIRTETDNFFDFNINAYKPVSNMNRLWK